MLPADQCHKRGRSSPRSCLQGGQVFLLACAWVLCANPQASLAQGAGVSGGGSAQDHPPPLELRFSLLPAKSLFAGRMGPSVGGRWPGLRWGPYGYAVTLATPIGFPAQSSPPQPRPQAKRKRNVPLGVAGLGIAGLGAYLMSTLLETQSTARECLAVTLVAGGAGMAAAGFSRRW